MKCICKNMVEQDPHCPVHEWDKVIVDEMYYDSDERGYVDFDKASLVDLCLKYFDLIPRNRFVRIKCRNGCIQIERITGQAYDKEQAEAKEGK